jgi:hypothetical protein
MTRCKAAGPDNILIDMLEILEEFGNASQIYATKYTAQDLYQKILEHYLLLYL